VSEDSSRAVWLPQARPYLRHADRLLARLIDDRPDFAPRAWMAQLPPMDLYGALLFQVTGQQLSVPASSARSACPGGRSARCATWPNGWRTAGWTRRC
jgi:hypothetical protein